LYKIQVSSILVRPNILLEKQTIHSMKKFLRIKYGINFFVVTFLLSFVIPQILFAQPGNNTCAGAFNITTAITCNTGTSRLTGQTLQNATNTFATSACGNTASQDVWYMFTAQTAYPVITTSNPGSSWGSRMCIQLLSSTGPCAGLTPIACVNATSLDTRTAPGGAGLTIGNLYYIRIHKNNAAAPTGSNWGFDICVTDPAPSIIDFGKSYINVTKGATGGTVDVGDVLEIRATFVIRDPAYSGTTKGAADSLAFYDTLFNGKGFKLLSAVGSIATKTNEGTDYQLFTNAFDGDGGQGLPIGATLDTAIRIHFGLGASGTARGRLNNTSKPSVFGASCIMMATYRVQVYASYGTKINWGGGSFSYRDAWTGVGGVKTFNFKKDSLIVYSSPGLCANAVSTTNAVGVESNGTFGVPVNPAPLIRNRAASPYVPGYIYSTFGRVVGGPGDYYYGITNNTSAEFGINNTRPKPDIDPDGAGPLSKYRVFDVWDISGDHTGAANPLKGNLPCDTTQPVSATNPCGYMLVVNSSYKTDTAFQYTVTGLCPSTYYELSAWVKNICSRCGCDSNGNTPTSAGVPNPLYLPSGPFDSAGVKPNLAFEINGTDYYTTGNVKHQGAVALVTTQGSDSTNAWIKKGFVYKTGPSETGFSLTIRNNAPGGGGNDWALDDIKVANCLPNMSYSPSTVPNWCINNPVFITDTVRSVYNNYVYYKWERSANGSGPWTAITGNLGPAAPTFNGSIYEYVATYTVPWFWTGAVNANDKYRLVVSTTAPNLSDPNCSSTDVINTVTINYIECLWPLNVTLLSFNGKLADDFANLSWTTSKEDASFHFDIQKSFDGVNYTTIGTVNSYSNNVSETNQYSFIDPVKVDGKAHYRIVMVSNDNKRKISRVIQLTKDVKDFSFGTVINPFSNELQFEVFVPKNASIEAELIDQNGKTVKKRSFYLSAGTNSLSIQDADILSQGIYTLRLHNSNGSIITKRVMKK
jgi:trimeric autotransporter adhesin